MKLINVTAQPELTGALYRKVYGTGFREGSREDISVYLSGNKVICRHGAYWRAFDMVKCRVDCLDELDAYKILGIRDWREPGIPTTDGKEEKIIEQLLTFFFQAIEARVKGNEIKQAFQEAFYFPLPYEVTTNYVTGGLIFRVKVEAEEKRRVTFQQVINKLALMGLRLGKAG